MLQKLRLAVILCHLLLTAVSVQAQNPETLKTQLWQELTQQPVWVFFGDSNTNAGGYVATIDAWLRANQINVNGKPIRIINLGVSSETSSGLSEVDHPFKRPCVHERLDKALSILQPNVVFACYGMNDGIYDPPSAENLKAYQVGMTKFREAVRVRGSHLVVLTPPIFEPEPVAAKGNLGPSDQGRYAYFAPYPKYDDVLAEQAQWCLKNELKAHAVVDLHSFLHAEKKKQLASDPKFAYSGDGVHFGDVAHQLIAQRLLETLGAPEDFMRRAPSSEERATAKKRMEILRDAYLAAVGKNRPGTSAGLPVWYAEKLCEGL